MRNLSTKGLTKKVSPFCWQLHDIRQETVIQSPLPAIFTHYIAVAWQWYRYSIQTAEDYIMRNKDAMKEPWLQEVVPAQQSGQSSFTHSLINCRNASHANECYHIAAERLLHVNRWNEYAGKATASFQLFDETGNSINRPVQKNDYLRINIPGPDNPDEGGDWVQVQQMGEKSTGEQQLTFITVKACPNPLTANTGPTHFFDQPATSTFVIFRKQLTIIAAVFGRNEHPNQKSRHLLTRIRNWFVYLGAQLGLANLQWKALTHGLLNVKE